MSMEKISRTEDRMQKKVNKDELRKQGGEKEKDKGKKQWEERIFRGLEEEDQQSRIQK